MLPSCSKPLLLPPVSEPTEIEEMEYYYQPESWTMRKDTIYAARNAIQIGICYAEDALALLDRSDLPPYMRRITEHTIQQQLDKMHEAYKQLAEPNGSVID